ncbi:inositol hexakisphosphate and diphosphoinositol-pentakisphosphate kinase 2 [Dorcoceras hygrometricum]|uniref:Inositol hexakisphosphate and diphosphoinositol-pentakisphosphate kinase 2 n=1 Tax=Dorcoceras hygrometricum TaxID=472368 RepID=A0A2Z7BVK3_9LAMI|nr:inositol hexakisphosphate and diphosphoinositol-pentakisphosphate kinase 2 [Dorcoceras hygrometricum]
MHRLLHASGYHRIPMPYDSKGGSTDDLNNAHKESKLTRSDTVANRIGSERKKTRRAGSDLKRRLVQDLENLRRTVQI